MIRSSTFTLSTLGLLLLLSLIAASLQACIAFVPLMEFEEPNERHQYQNIGEANNQAPRRVVRRVRYSRKAVVHARNQSKLTRLLNGLSHSEATVRAYSASELSRYGAQSNVVVPALQRSLRDRNKYVRRNSAKSLGAMRSRARSAVPSLINVLRDRDEYVAHSAANALRKINTREARIALQSFRDRVRLK